ncbi:Retrovirus-related Pol polyprotein from transposon RE1 [Vitis vinifera]|uniref:Retrovirus-related Pol polyprotein from transposon RE1 n=1 Tax=Vitis vinifera TaxID=29760 RepID=A0A438G7F7_VITVI|nr:Retrovirus-related Pol polyprotein from transposon RE1 [Vitis vinifera]
MTWILSSVEPHLVLNLRPYKTVAAMWNYLHTVYNQDNSARSFQLEYEMANFTHGSISIEEYFSGFQIFGLIIPTLFMLMFSLQLSLLSKQCMQLATTSVLDELMQHMSRIRVKICVLSSALVVNIVVTLLWIVPRSYVTTARNKFYCIACCLLVVLIHVPTALANPTLTPEMDQVSGKMIAKGPKVGRLFPLHVSPSTIIPSFPLLSFACNVVGSRHKMWHRRLGHLNSDCFLELIETQFPASIKVLCSNSSGEYMSNEFQDFLQSKGIISQCSCPSTPQQNDVADRKNRHLLDVVRTLLLDEALSTVVHLINRLPSSMINHVSPFSKLFGHSLLYSDLRTFGCVRFVHLPTHEQHKLIAQSIKCAFLGYAIPHKGYVCYDPHARRIRVSRNVIFFENQYFFPSHVKLPSAFVFLLPNFFESPTIVERFKPGFVYERHSRYESNSTSSVPPFDLDLTPDPALASTTLRRSTRLSRPLDWYGLFSHVSLVATLSTISIPSCYKQAMEHECWQNAMQAELQALEENHTWDIVPCPPTVNLLGKYEVDYEETFAPVAKMTTVRTILVIVASQSWQLHQMDVKMFFFMASGIFVNQHKYIQDLITLLGLEDTSSVDTPMEVSQFMTSPRHLHLDAVRRIIRYLRGSPTRGLFFPIGSSLQLVAYSDADWARCQDTRRSTTGWCMFLGDGLISWRCKKQDRVSKSTTEAEYRVMSTACSEIVWLRDLLEELGFPHTTSTPLHANNTSAIRIATNPVFHEHTKHIEVDCHSIRDTLESRVTSLSHISFDLQVADIFTKALTRQQNQFLVGKLLLVDLPTLI